MTERQPRVEQMIDYLRQHADAIEGLVAGRVQFDFGKDVVGQITRFDKLPSPPCRLSA